MTTQEAGDGGAAPSDWLQVWLTLIDRLDLIQETRTPSPPVRLVFDSDDQARLA